MCRNLFEIEAERSTSPKVADYSNLGLRGAIPLGLHESISNPIEHDSLDEHFSAHPVGIGTQQNNFTPIPKLGLRRTLNLNPDKAFGATKRLLRD